MLAAKKREDTRRGACHVSIPNGIGRRAKALPIVELATTRRAGNLANADEVLVKQ
jgi:hypothetical protein